jgi:hypothetical protein
VEQKQEFARIINLLPVLRACRVPKPLVLNLNLEHVGFG